MKKVISTAIIVTIIILGSPFLLKKTGQAPTLQQNNQQLSQVQQQSEPQQSNEIEQPKISDESGVMQNKVKHEILYTDAGYVPSELNIKVGDTATFINQSSNGMWTASAMHPSHMVYSGTSLQEHCPDKRNASFDQCRSSQPGEVWEFTFNKAGTFGYHNHVMPSHFGKITVELMISQAKNH